MSAPRVAASVPATTPSHWRPTWLGWLIAGEGVLLLGTLGWSIQQRPLASLVGIALLAALAANAWLSRRWLTTASADYVVPARVIAGEDTLLSLRLSAGRALPPLTISSASPEGEPLLIGQLCGLDHGSARLAWSLRFPRRGWHQLAPVTASNEQPFGLGRAQRIINPGQPLLVLPARGLLRRELHTRLDTWLEQIASSRDPGADELARLRPYRPGDAPRSVHWRASARARELLVAERHTPAARHLALVIDTDAALVTPRRLDRLVSVAATFIDHLLRRGWEVSLHGRFASAGVLGDRDHLLATLAMLETQPADHELAACLPRDRTCLVLAARAISLPTRHPRPLLLTLDECEQLVRLPKRLGF